MDEEGPNAAIQSPPARLEEPNISVLAGGTVVHRVHAPGFGGNAFNPCRGGPSRFAPIQNTHGECVPSLYAATSLPAAIFETLFHDIPLEATTEDHTAQQRRSPPAHRVAASPGLTIGQSARPCTSQVACRFRPCLGAAQAVRGHRALGQGNSRSIRGCGRVDLDVTTMRSGLGSAVLR